MKWKSVYALGFLGYHFALRMGKKALGRRSPGLEQFLGYYRKDHISTLNVEERNLLYQASRCLQCGLCDQLCYAQPHHDAAHTVGSSFGPSFYIAGLSRSLVDMDTVPALPTACGSCAGCEVVCPVQVPIAHLFRFLEDKRKEV